MKTTNRIQRNGAAIATSSQVKTQPEKPPVTVVFFSHEKDREVLKLDLPAVSYAAFERAAKEIKLSRDRFFKLAMTETIARHSPPVPANSAAPSNPIKRLIPSQVAEQAEAALKNLERTGNAAVAFVMMNGYEIEQRSQNNDGWAKLEVSGFSAGALELARMVSTEFQSVMAELNRVARAAIAAVQTFHAPIEIDPADKNFRLRDELDPTHSWSRIGNAVDALLLCINQQSWALIVEPGSDAESTCGGCYLMGTKLKAANKAIDGLVIHLLDCYCAVASGT